jgi:hypothetical protein
MRGTGRQYLLLLLLLLLEYVYPTERVQLRDRRIAREKKYIQKTLPKDVKRMFFNLLEWTQKTFHFVGNS